MTECEGERNPATRFLAEVRNDMWAGIWNHQAVRYDGEWLPLGTSLWGRLVARSHVTGDHKGRPYGKRGRRGMMWEGEGRFENRLYGGGWSNG